jgi:hypothetical protein
MTTRFDTINVTLMSLGMNSAHLKEEERGSDPDGIPVQVIR